MLSARFGTSSLSEEESLIISSAVTTSLMYMVDIVCNAFAHFI